MVLNQVIYVYQLESQKINLRLDCDIDDNSPNIDDNSPRHPYLLEAKPFKLSLIRILSLIKSFDSSDECSFETANK